MLCDIVAGTDTIRLLNNHLQTTGVSRNRKKWERELTTDNTRREAQAVQDAAETLHENFVKRAAQTDSICHLAITAPHPVLVCGDFNSLPHPTPTAGSPDSSKTASRRADTAICTPTVTASACCVSTTPSIHPNWNASTTTLPIWIYAATTIR